MKCTCGAVLKDRKAFYAHRDADGTNFNKHRPFRDPSASTISPQQARLPNLLLKALEQSNAFANDDLAIVPIDSSSLTNLLGEVTENCISSATNLGILFDHTSTGRTSVMSWRVDGRNVLVQRFGGIQPKPRNSNLGLIEN